MLEFDLFHLGETQNRELEFEPMFARGKTESPSLRRFTSVDFYFLQYDTNGRKRRGKSLRIDCECALRSAKPHTVDGVRRRKRGAADEKGKTGHPAVLT